MRKTILVFCFLTAPLYADLVIMHAGDSIQANPLSRLKMHDLFSAASIPIDFVGHNMSYTGTPDIDNQSWGSMRWGQIHSGWTVVRDGMEVEELGLVDGIPDFMPDIVILGGGTNNVLQEMPGSPMTAPLAELNALVDFVVAQGVPLLLATVPAIQSGPFEDYQSNVTTINNLIQTNFASRAGVTVVDLNAYMSDPADFHFSDGVHFSDAGYQKLGQFWFNEIVASGATVPEPSAFALMGLAVSLLLPNCMRGVWAKNSPVNA